jgi:hypothetical protein
MQPLGNFLTGRLIHALPSEAKKRALVVLREDPVLAARAEQLASSLERFASGPDFAEAVNLTVPPPSPGESEEEFVSRAKEAILVLLMAKFAR